MQPININACKQEFYLWVDAAASNKGKNRLITGSNAFYLKKLFNDSIENAATPQSARKAFAGGLNETKAHFKPESVGVIRKAAFEALKHALTPVESSSSSDVAINVNACSHQFSEWVKTQQADKKITTLNAEHLEKVFQKSIQDTKNPQEAKDTFSQAFLPMSRHFKKGVVPLVRHAAFKAIDDASQAMPKTSSYVQRYLDLVKGDGCAICVDDFSEDDFTFDTNTEMKTHKTFCAHFFHKTCLEQWKQEQGDHDTVTCPLCRTESPSFKEDAEKWKNELRTAHEQEQEAPKAVTKPTSQSAFTEADETAYHTAKEAIINFFQDLFLSNFFDHKQYAHASELCAQASELLLEGGAPAQSIVVLLNQIREVGANTAYIPADAQQLVQQYISMVERRGSV